MRLTWGTLFVLSGILASAEAAGKTVEERLKALEDKFGTKEAGKGPEAGATGAEKPAIEMYFKDGLYAKLSDGNFDIHIGGRVIIHYRQFFLNPERVSKDSFSIREIKLDLRGTICKDWEFAVEPDTTGPNFFIDDGYVGFVHFPWLKLRVGQFKAPFSMDQLTSTLFIDFPERSPMDRLVPNYELGAMVHGEPIEKIWNYAIMVANGTNRAGVDENSDKDLFIRTWVRPAAKTDIVFLKGLHLGIDVGFGKRNLGLSVMPYNYSPPTSQTTFVTAGPNAAFVRFDDNRGRILGEFGWLLGPASVKAEYEWTRDSYRFPGGAPGDVGRGGHANHEAWYVSASCFVTGEEKTWGRPHPKHNFLDDGGVGAIEALVRYGRFNVPGDLFRDGILSRDNSAQTVDEYSLCLSWYPNPNVRVAVQYCLIEYKGAAIRPVLVNGRRFDHEDVLVARFQVDF